ncbi:nitrilase-related carbon-nitrogen hydrolase [Pseudonocardia nigra]|uniref:nitrilase-related carbon-nitrogen hydrolase n=1 Tax=Pseudonocardia nigra TaxID=1921578 RepID=UPI001C5D5D7A|nr:nitrilase-related carbon-nitrogen hydrolase [Pseudonocardia nigra]
MTRVVCRQLAPVLGDLEANRQASADAVRDAVAAGAEIVVLPELVTSGYVFADRAEAAAAAITPGHPLFADWAAAAGRAVVVGGFCERGGDGGLYNSAAVVDAGGVRAVYRKTHLWDREKLVFDQGDDRPPVVDTAAGRLGVLICYDLEFPESTRDLAVRGADLLVAPVNWPLVDRPAGERPPEVVIAMAAARVNRVAIACCDRAGPERGQRWTEGTTIIDCSGWVAATPGPDGAAVADLDLAASRDKALSPRNHAFGDRRPELYDGEGPLSSWETGAAGRRRPTNGALVG